MTRDEESLKAASSSLSSHRVALDDINQEELGNDDDTTSRFDYQGTGMTAVQDAAADATPSKGPSPSQSSSSHSRTGMAGKQSLGMDATANVRASSQHSYGTSSTYLTTGNGNGSNGSPGLSNEHRKWL